MNNWLYHARINLKLKKESLSKKKKDETKHGHFCKNWRWPKIGRGREGWQPPIPPGLMGAISPVSSIKHIKVLDKFHISQTSGQSVNATLPQNNWRLYVWYKVLMMMEIVERLRNRNIQKMQ